MHIFGIDGVCVWEGVGLQATSGGIPPPTQTPIYSINIEVWPSSGPILGLSLGPHWARPGGPSMFIGYYKDFFKRFLNLFLTFLFQK